MAYEDNMKHQLIMLDTKWGALKANGVTDETEMILEFTYLAPNKKSANVLKNALDIYDSSVRAEGWLKIKWYVDGKSYPTPVSSDDLSQWLSFMVSLGWEHDCEFEGFDASIP